MAEINISQAEADSLIAVHKKTLSDISLPIQGEGVQIKVVSHDKKEEFIVDISRGTIKLQKSKEQLRAREVVILLRLDIESSPHRNPDGTEISGSHLHIYKENLGDRFAIEIPRDKFTNTGNLIKTVEEFLRYCNIDVPKIQGSI